MTALSETCAPSAFISCGRLPQRPRNSDDRGTPPRQQAGAHRGPRFPGPPAPAEAGAGWATSPSRPATGRAVHSVRYAPVTPSGRSCLWAGRAPRLPRLTGRPAPPRAISVGLAWCRRTPDGTKAPRARVACPETGRAEGAFGDTASHPGGHRLGYRRRCAARQLERGIQVLCGVTCRVEVKDQHRKAVQILRIIHFAQQLRWNMVEISCEVINELPKLVRRCGYVLPAGGDR
jgi:hypothetical protein